MSRDPEEEGPSYRPPTGWLAGPGPGRAYPSPEPSGETTGAAARGNGDDTDADADADDQDGAAVSDTGDFPTNPSEPKLPGEPRLPSWLPEVPDVPGGARVERRTLDTGTDRPGTAAPDRRDMAAPDRRGGGRETGGARPDRGPEGSGDEAGAGQGGRGRARGSWDPDDSLAAWRTRAPAAPAHCPHCRAVTRPSDRYCLRCRYEFATGRRPGAPQVRALHPTTQRWEVVIETDAAHFDRQSGDGVRLPDGRAPRVVRLAGPTTLIGSRSTGPRPAVDLSGPVDDPAVSRTHASLVRQPDGGYAVVDHGSRNGTRVNDDSQPITPGQLVALRDGDRVYVGAWTRLTVRRSR